MATAPQALAGPPAFATVGTVSPDFPVSVTIATVQPTAPGATGTLVITGQVTNAGSAPVKNAHVGLELGRNQQPLTNRSDIASMLARSTPAGSDGRELDNPKSPLNDLAPGVSVSFRLSVAMSDLKLDQGVYELAVDVQGGTAENDSTHPVGVARTLLPSFPDAKDTKPTQVATLWPVIHAPELVAQTTADPEPVPVLRDDTLAADLAPNGRLGQLVSIGTDIQSQSPLTWVIDPDLLDTVLAMTKPYRVQMPKHGGETARTDNTTAGQGQAVASAWLDELRKAVTAGGAEVVALPYADPDLASIAHNGSGLAGLDTALGKARTAGKLTAEGRLAADVRDNVAWPYQGYLDQQIAGTAQRLGDSLVLVNGAGMPEAGSLNHTPNAARPIGNGQTAVVADGTIAGLFDSDLNSQESQTQAEQRFAAETLAITLQEPSNQRTLLVMPPRDLTAGTAKALAASLKSAQDGRWITGATLDTVAAAAADPRANTTVPSPQSYPSQLRATELSATDFAGVSGMQQRVDLLLRILTLPQRVRGPFSAAMVRSVSTQWRDQQQAGHAFRANVQSYLNQLVSAVNIPAKSNIITLPGDSGLLQVSVRNDLSQTVTNLELRLTSDQPYRLKVSVPVQIVLDAAHSTSVRFTAQAQGNGLVPMTAQLWTTGADAQPYGPAVQFKVDVTKVPSGVWWVVGTGGVLVLLAGARIYIQRKRQTGEPEDPDAPLVDPNEPSSTPGSDGAAAQP